MTTPKTADAVEPTRSALPSALVFDGGDGVRIEASNRERTSWAIRQFGECLNTNGEWEYELCPSDRNTEFLSRTRWPSPEAAWAALLDYRAAKEVNRGSRSESSLDPDAMPLG